MNFDCYFYYFKNPLDFGLCMKARKSKEVTKINTGFYSLCIKFEILVIISYECFYCSMILCWGVLKKRFREVCCLERETNEFSSWVLKFAYKLKDQGWMMEIIICI